MKIYLLQIHNDDRCEMFGVYSSREKAVESLPYHPIQMTEEDIEEIELDPPHGQERHETFYMAQICEDGTRFLDDAGRWLLPSCPDIQRVHYLKLYGRKTFAVGAYGRTIEEAEQKAKAALSSLHPVWQVSRYRDGGPKFNEMHHPHPSCVHRFESVEGLEDTVYAVHEDLNVARIAIMEYEKTGAIAPCLSHPLNRQPAQP